VSSTPKTLISWTRGMESKWKSHKNSNQGKRESLFHGLRYRPRVFERAELGPRSLLYIWMWSDGKVLKTHHCPQNTWLQIHGTLCLHSDSKEADIMINIITVSSKIFRNRQNLPAAGVSRILRIWFLVFEAANYYIMHHQFASCRRDVCLPSIPRSDVGI
jgi:hypothetical protein